MVYTVESDSFTKLSNVTGTLQNKVFGQQQGCNLEVADDPIVDSGIIIEPGKMISLNGTDIYLRCVDEGQTAKVVVVPFKVEKEGGGGSSSGQGVVIDGTTYHVADSADTDDLIDEYFPD